MKWIDLTEHRRGRDWTATRINGGEMTEKTMSWRGNYQPATRETSVEAGVTATVLSADVKDTVEKAIREAEKIKADDRYTPEHKRREIRKLAVEATDRVREVANGDIDGLRTEIEEKRAALRTRAVPPRKPDDASGTMLDGEIRAYLREMDSTERAKLLMTSTSTEVLEAALRAPAFMSGIDPEVYETLTERTVEVRHADDLAELEAAEGNVRALSRTIENGYRLLTELGGPIQHSTNSAEDKG